MSTKTQTDEERFSLPLQEADGRALCEREGWQIVASLTVPGHSRRYVDIHKLAEDARKEGIDAFDRILDLWERKAFDVLICRDGDRFARTQSLHAYFAEMTIDIGARIYSLADGWIDEKNYRMWAAMSGYKSASHVDGLVKARQSGMAKRMERGLSGGNALPMVYRYVRDESGKADRIEFRPEFRRMVDDAARLLLLGVGWKAFAVDLAKQYGHVQAKTNFPYGDNTFYRLFHNPITWGITAKNFEGKLGLWVFDGNEPLPKGVTVNRRPNPPIPPLWEGELAEQIKAELRRRNDILQGRATARGNFAFTGLFVCASCGRRLAVDNKVKYLYWRCSSHTYRLYQLEQVCTNKKLLRNDVAQHQIDEFLHRLLAQNSSDLTPLLSVKDEIAQQRQRLIDLRGEILTLSIEVDNMIVQQSKAPTNVQDRYTTQIERASQRLSTLENEVKHTEATLELPSVTQTRHTAYSELVSMGLNGFWELAPHEINQSLHKLLGKHRFIVEGGEIIELR